MSLENPFSGPECADPDDIRLDELQLNACMDNMADKSDLIESDGEEEVQPYDP